MAIAALTAACLVPAVATAADLKPCAGGSRCGSVAVPLVAADPAAGSVNVSFEVYTHRRAGKARDTILVSAGSDGVPTTAGRAEIVALLAPLRDHRDIVLVDARGTGRSGLVGARRDAYGAGAAAQDLDAVRATLGVGHVELYGAGDGARVALAYAARFGDRLRALVLDGGPRATLFSGDGHGEAHALARGLGHGEPAVARLAARLRTHPLHFHGRIDDDVLARVAASGDAATLGELPAASTAALHGDPMPLARLAVASASAAGRQAAQAQASSCHDDAAPAPAAQVDGGPFTGATWRRALGLAGCLGWPKPAVPDPVLPPDVALSGAPALVLAGELDVRAPAATLRKVAALLPKGTYVRARSAGALPALGDSGGCAATIARAFLQTRGRVRAGCASRRSQPLGVGAFPLTLAASPAALRDATAHGRDHSTLADRRAATAAALGVTDMLAAATAPGAPARVTGLRGGSASVIRSGTHVSLTAHGMRFVRDAALEGIVSYDSATGSVFASVTLSAADGSQRPFVLSWSTHQVGGLGTARGSSSGRPLLLVLKFP
ncbi:MAG TPA: alpha/beta hydrolase [Gaiellales bacterium]|jgi:pimeloyl-ACP methyl ester carboxylesterase|nr:alpha/beta hydrolase [Gaiellales bacterium]